MAKSKVGTLRGKKQTFVDEYCDKRKRGRIESATNQIQRDEDRNDRKFRDMARSVAATIRKRLKGTGVSEQRIARAAIDVAEQFCRGDD